MPTYSTLEALLARIVADMTANGAKENTGVRTQNLLIDMATSLIAIIGAAPTGDGAIPEWDETLQYDANTQVFVEHDGVIYVYVGVEDNTGTAPGTDPTLWQDMSALLLSHVQGTDQALDAGGPNEVTAEELREHLDNPEPLPLEDVLATGYRTGAHNIGVDSGQRIEFRGPESDGMLQLKPESVTDDNALLLPNKSGTLATLDDIAAVEAMIDGSLKAPEAFSPAGSYPTTYGGMAIQRGDTFRLAAGTMGAVTSNAEDLAVALVDTPGQTDANWQVIESNRTVVGQTAVEDSATADNSSIVSPVRWWQAWVKGLTLAAFFSAVKGTLLGGWTVGSNTTIANTDSLTGALGKAQGQINATNTAVALKLAKASNLSDVASASTSRTNLGLGLLATKSYAEALVDNSPITQAAHGFSIGNLVGFDGTNWLLSDGTTEAGARVIGMVIEVPDSTRFRLLRRGVWVDDLFNSFFSGEQYWLDPATPGAFTRHRPSGIAVPVFVAMASGSKAIDFNPRLNATSSGVARTSGDFDTEVEVGDGGEEVPELFFWGEQDGTYHVRLIIDVNSSAGTHAPIGIIPDDGIVKGSAVMQWALDGNCTTVAFTDAGDFRQTSHAMEAAAQLNVRMDVYVTVLESGGGYVRVWLAAGAGDTSSTYRDARLTWDRID